MPDTRLQATPADVDRWVRAVQSMTAAELGDFERRIRGAYQPHSLIDLVRAIVVRRVELERPSWFRVKPTHRKPADGFLATGPLYRG